jgi:hypothetical protein
MMGLAALTNQLVLNMSSFADGELFETTFQTSQGLIGMLAEVSIKGQTLHLKDIVVEPRETTKLTLSSGEVLAVRQRLKQTARDAGFQILRITGERLTGAKVGKRIDLIMDLKS